MLRHRTVIIFTAVALALSVIVLGFSGWLNVVSFKKNYVNSLVANYSVAGGEARRKIEYAVKYGKPLTNFYAINDLLAEVKANNAAIEDVRLVVPDGHIVYALGQDGMGNSLTRELAAKADFRTDLPGRAYILALSEGKYHTFIPVRDRQDMWIASLDIVFAEAVVNTAVNEYVGPLIKVMVMIAVLTVFCLTACFLFIPLWDAAGQIRKKRILVILVAVLGTAQLAYGVVNTASFKTIYIDMTRTNTTLAASIAQKDINRVVQMGMPYYRLAGIEDWLQRIIRTVPEIEKLSVTDAQGSILYAAPTTSAGSRPVVQSPLQYTLPLIADQTGVNGTLNIVLSQSYINGKVTDIFLDALTLSLTSFFFMVETILFVLLFINLKVIKSGDNGDETVQTGMIRPLAFLFFLATDMSVSFIPLQMKNLYEPLFGLSQNAVIGLPISVEMFCASLTAIATGFIIDKKGWRFPFLSGMAMLFTGVLLSGLAKSALLFVIARGIVGTGFGFSWMSLRGYVAASRSSAARTKGFSQLNAGIYAGNICACALGAMLAERLGYAGVFFIAVAVVVVTAAFAACLVKGNNHAVATDAAPAKRPAAPPWAKFFGDANVVGLMLLITIPSALCLTGFLNYFFPLYANHLGVSPANTGRAFMIYGICIVYLGPFCGKYIAQSKNGQKPIISASCIGVAALLVFAWEGGIAGALAAILLFGLADSIGFIAQNTFLLNLAGTKAFGEGKALGFFSMTKKLGQMLGPAVFAWAAGNNAEQGVGWVGAAYLLTVALFLLGTKQPEAAAKQEI